MRIFANKDPSSQSYVFSSSHVWMWVLDCEESWAPKNWCFWTVVLEKTLASPLDCKGIRPVNPRGNQSWIFIGKDWCWSSVPIFWSPDLNNWLIGKDPDGRKDWRQEEKGTTGDEMVGCANSGSWWWTGKPDVAKSHTGLSDWTDWGTKENPKSSQWIVVYY